MGVSLHFWGVSWILNAVNRQVPVDTPETENDKEPSDNDTNALKQNDMVKHKHNDIDEHENNNTNHIGIVDAPLPRA